MQPIELRESDSGFLATYTDYYVLQETISVLLKAGIPFSVKPRAVLDLYEWGLQVSEDGLHAIHVTRDEV